MEYFITIRSSEPGMIRLTQIKCTTNLSEAVDFATNQFVGDLGCWNMYIFHCKYQNDDYEVLKSVTLLDVIESIRDDEGYYKSRDLAWITVEKLLDIILLYLYINL